MKVFMLLLGSDLDFDICDMILCGTAKSTAESPRLGLIRIDFDFEVDNLNLTLCEKAKSTSESASFPVVWMTVTTLSQHISVANKIAEAVNGMFDSTVDTCILGGIPMSSKWSDGTVEICKFHNTVP